MYQLGLEYPDFVDRYIVFVHMKIKKDYIIIYGSLTGNARRVAQNIQQKLEAKLYNSKEFYNLDDILKSNSNSAELVFVASTWGDGELQSDMENLLINSTKLKTPKLCHIVELGNYYGYDDFEFGALFTSYGALKIWDFILGNIYPLIACLGWTGSHYQIGWKK